ncbi:hypothetical protein XELAEV_18015287mg [Xenopus laevis]|uniref:Secreted protein n=1 Tax=Xenopus laevis TaxID=8355 RepID=A0A974DIU6_XENLA|nr:hypothetical protein XELAEV_18015287mg [Xenopus laevis]
MLKLTFMFVFMQNLAAFPQTKACLACLQHLINEVARILICFDLKADNRQKDCGSWHNLATYVVNQIHLILLFSPGGL